jgi:thiamine-phosphate diphosphorylase
MQRALVASGSNLRAKRAQALRGLHVVIDPAATGKHDAGWVAEQVLLGGASALLLDAGTLGKGGWYPLALQLRELCEEKGAALLIAGHPDVVVAVGADGVHLASHDLPLSAARRVLAPWQIAGVAGASVGDAQTALETSADYVSVGDVTTLRSVRELMPTGGPPLIAMGDISRENVGELAQAGADAICAGEVLTSDADPKLATINLLLHFSDAR